MSNSLEREKKEIITFQSIIRAEKKILLIFANIIIQCPYFSLPGFFGSFFKWKFYFFSPLTKKGEKIQWEL